MHDDTPCAAVSAGNKSTIEPDEAASRVQDRVCKGTLMSNFTGVGPQGRPLVGRKRGQLGNGKAAGTGIVLHCGAGWARHVRREDAAGPVRRAIHHS